MFLLKKYFGYLMAAEKELDTSTSSSSTSASTSTSTTPTDTSTEGTTTKDPDTSDGITISKATLVVKDKAGNVGIVNGLTNNDIAIIKTNINNTAAQAKEIASIKNSISSEELARKNADITLQSNITAETQARIDADAKLVTLTTTQTISGTKTFSAVTKSATPDTDSSDTSVATTANVDAKITDQCVKLTGAQYAKGRKYFHDGITCDWSVQAPMFSVKNNYPYVDFFYGNKDTYTTRIAEDAEGKTFVDSTSFTIRGKGYTTTPDTSSNDTSIPTTAWVNNKINNSKIENTTYGDIAVSCQSLGLKSTQLNAEATSGAWCDLRFYDRKGVRMGYLGVQNSGDGYYTTSFGLNRDYNDGQGMRYFNLWNCSVGPDGRYLVRMPQVMPVGTMVAFAVANKIPDGFLYCNGAAVSRTTYSDLFNTIGTTWGAGDGSTTFNIPNAWFRFLEGGYVGAVVSAGLPNITGYANSASEATYSTPNGCFYNTANGGATEGHGYNIAALGFNAKNSNNIYGQSSTVQPPAIGVDYIIKY